jgi:hypothetical protein
VIGLIVFEKFPPQRQRINIGSFFHWERAAEKKYRRSRKIAICGGIFHVLSTGDFSSI